MEQQQTWEQAVASVQSMYRDLSLEKRAQLDGLVEEIMQIKQELVVLALSAGSSEICRTCGGKCCLHGKFHVTVLDVLAFQSTDASLVIPDFSIGPYCPYSDVSGCLMTPRFRPMTCVIFNCNLIEDRLSSSDLAELEDCEKRLRNAISRSSQISTTRLDRPVLLTAEK